MAEENQNIISPPVSKKIDWFKILALIIGLLIVIGLFLNAYLLLKKPQPGNQIPILPTPTSATSEITNWKTFSSNELFFKYPNSWNRAINNKIIGNNPDVSLQIVTKDTPLRNDCMKLDATEKKTGLVVRRLSRVSNEMCTDDTMSFKEIWVVPEEDSYSPGISYRYSVKDNPEAENVFAQILSTFKFTDNQEVTNPELENKYSGLLIKKTTIWAPEMSYNYEMVFDKPVGGVKTGLGIETIEQIMVKDNPILNLEQYADKHINFMATFEWYLGSTRYLNITKILP